MHLSPPQTDREAKVAAYLRDALNELSTRSLATWKRDPDLFLCGIDIKPTVLSLLVQILNLPLHVQSGNKQKWGRLWLSDCFITVFPNTLHDKYRHCTRDNVQVLLSTMMSRTDTLELIKCPEIVACLTQLDQLEVKSLYINPGTTLDDNVYERLGDMIQRSAHLTELHLELRFDEAPPEMFESLSNAINLKKLELRKWRPRYLKEHEVRDEILSNLVVGEEGPGVVVRLLQNPQSLLEHLDLGCLGMEDRHFIAIARLLPTTNLKYLDVSNNNIQARGILEFAPQLPRLESLQKIVLLPNPWLPDRRYCAHAKECVAALAQGMIENYSVEDLEMGMNPDRSTLEEYPQASLLLHLADINRAGRRILATSTFIPLGLWPYILERAGTSLSYPFRHKILTGEDANANALYFLLRNCPMSCNTTKLIFAEENMMDCE